MVALKLFGHAKNFDGDSSNIYNTSEQIKTFLRLKQLRWKQNFNISSERHEINIHNWETVFAHSMHVLCALTLFLMNTSRWARTEHTVWGAWSQVVPMEWPPFIKMFISVAIQHRINDSVKKHESSCPRRKINHSQISYTVIRRMCKHQ